MNCYLDLEWQILKLSWSKGLISKVFCKKCSVRKRVLRNFAKFTRKHLCQSLFLIKVQASFRFLWLWWYATKFWWQRSFTSGIYHMIWGFYCNFCILSLSYNDSIPHFCFLKLPLRQNVVKILQTDIHEPGYCTIKYLTETAEFKKFHKINSSHIFFFESNSWE